ncbi:hypothetical protein [Chitinimonas sp.]|uniref:hypothetical protein n=1 Tax=Chitinimonas sp. TaxID=1934313 RepID=UPI0035B28A44
MSKPLLSLIAGAALLATACQHTLAASSATRLRSDTGSWQCPAGQNCDDKPDYRALLSHDGAQEIYLLFGPQLRTPFDAAQLKQHFRFGDLYYPSAQGNIALHITADESGDGKIEFRPAPNGRLLAHVEARRYRLRTEGKSPDCQIDDVKGVCIQEKRIDAPLSIDLELKLP